MLGTYSHGRNYWRWNWNSVCDTIPRVKFTQYFQAMRRRPDRSMIRLEWIQQVVNYPIREIVQKDGRIRRWAPIDEMDGKYLRVILLSDGETVHNAFFDRSFKP